MKANFPQQAEENAIITINDSEIKQYRENDIVVEMDAEDEDVMCGGIELLKV